MRNEYVTQPVAAVATELEDHFSDIGDEAISVVQLYDIRIHLPIIITGQAAHSIWSFLTLSGHMCVGRGWPARPNPEVPPRASELVPLTRWVWSTATVLQPR
jgi:hypothetical protein